MRATNWLLGGAVGLFVGGLALEAGIAVLLLLVPALIWVGTERTRPLGLAGLLVGVGIGAGGLLLWASARCASDPTCTMTDVSGFFAAAAVVAVIGLVLTVVGLRRTAGEGDGSG